MLDFKIRLQVDKGGKLRVLTQGDVGDVYIVIGFKIKAHKEKNYVYPILKVEMPKK